jgi:pyruvate dehydrogenase E1 component beta subunit
MPSSPYDAKGLLLAAIQDNNPIMFFEHKLLYKTKGPVPEEMYTIPLGQSHVVREGKDLTLIATSIMVSRAQQAAEQLAKEGIEIEIIDPRTLKPLDEKPIVESVIKTGKALIVHEAVKTGGFGGELAAVIMESEAFAYLDAPVRRLAGLDMPIPYNRNWNITQCRRWKTLWRKRVNW